MSAKVSIIVPVYRAEQYLEECVSSVLGQSRNDIEVLLVDDGSPDRCPEMCDAFAKKDSRCVVIHKENGGASSARNVGLKNASGEYVVFVDSDDTISDDCIEKLCLAMETTSSDYAAGAKFPSSGIRPYPVLNEAFEIKKEPRKLLRYLSLPGTYSPYAKLFKMAIIKEHGLRFDEELKCLEDALFVRQYMKYCGKVRLIPDTVYYYNQENDASLSKKVYPEYAGYFIKTLKAFDDLTDELGLSPKDKNAFLKERAVYGLKVSSEHYSRLEDKKTREERTRCCVEIFRPWLAIDGQIEDSSLAAWWKKHRRQIYSGDIDGYMNAIDSELKRRYFASGIKEPIKKVIRYIKYRK